MTSRADTCRARSRRASPTALEKQSSSAVAAAAVKEPDPVATAAQYCDCGFLEEELMSRVMTHNILNAVQTWLTNGAIIGAALGLVVAARPGVNAGMPVGWAYLAYVIALAAVANVLLWWFQFQSYPWNLVVIAIIAAVLVPAWAIWLAMRSEGLTLADSAD